MNYSSNFEFKLLIPLYDICNNNHLNLQHQIWRLSSPAAHMPRKTVANMCACTRADRLHTQHRDYRSENALSVTRPFFLGDGDPCSFGISQLNSILCSKFCSNTHQFQVKGFWTVEMGNDKNVTTILYNQSTIIENIATATNSRRANYDYISKLFVYISFISPKFRQYFFRIFIHITRVFDFLFSVLGFYKCLNPKKKNWKMFLMNFFARRFYDFSSSYA